MASTKGRALIILAEGAEEMEAVTAADVLRRGILLLLSCCVPTYKPGKFILLGISQLKRSLFPQEIYAAKH